MEVIARFRELFLDKYGEISKDSLDKALDIATKSLGDRKRYNGDPFIYHALGVATILIKDLHMGTTSVIAAILHDVVRNFPERLDEIEELFGTRVRETLMGMNNISNIETNHNSAQVEHFKNLIVSYSTNPRIILLKLADRLEVMQNLADFPQDVKEKKAWESLHIYSQIAHKLGLYGIKNEMEEVSLSYLEPDEYKHIKNKLKENEQEQADFIERFCTPIRKKLDLNRIEYKIKGRTKSIYSIWKKMRKQKISFEEVYDISAIRIILDTPIEAEKAMCWLCFSIVTDFYKPNPDRMRDWISIPKSNGYESLHTTVVTEEGKWVEVQIRTKRMDEIAECGIAAHWRYKGVKDDKEWLERLREVIESVKIDGDTLAFDSEIDTSTKEIFVFTPNGDIRKLPLGATLLDFAYDIHSQIGNQCVGGKINNKNVNIREVLNNGDLVEVKTSKNQTPKLDWLNSVVTSKAKSRIKAYLREQEVKQTEEIKDELERKIKNWKLAISFDEALTILCKYYKVKTGSELYQQLESEEISMLEAKDVLHKFINKELSLKTSEEKTQKITETRSNSTDDILMVDNDITNIKYNFAKCCNPIYGDSIKGFITVLNGITIHQSDCVNLAHLEARYPYRVMEAKWTDEHNKGVFMAKIAIYSDNILGLESDIKDIAQDLNIALRGIKSSPQGKQTYTEVQIEVPNKNVLSSMEYLLKNIKGVNRAFRL